MSGMFLSSNTFNKPLDNWDVSNVTDMSNMFMNASSYNQALNSWDVSSVTNMNLMFAGAANFNKPLNNWDISNVFDIDSMFNLAVSFNQPLDNWDVSNVTNMSSIFRNAHSFNQNLNNWDVSNVTSMHGVFWLASSYNQPMNNWNFNTTTLSLFLKDSGMSSLNYDLVLNRLKELGLVNGTLEANNLNYCDDFTRQSLINDGWSITDSGLADSCDLNFIIGEILYDENGDGCDSNDNSLSNFMIKVNNGIDEASYNINQSGDYSIGLSSGNYTLSILSLSNNLISSPSTQTVNFTGQNEIIDDVDFCITANQQFEDLSIDIFPLENVIPGLETNYQVVMTNNGSQIVPSIQVTFSYDSNFQSFVTSTETPSVNTTDLLTFDFINTEPFSSEVFEITMLNAVPPTLNGGEILTFTVQVTPDTNDANIEDNTAVLEQTVVNSFDPNDKLVIQGDEVADENIDQYLDYRIRFQNVGTANALNVKITDTISDKLDWTTFQPISSSHDFRIELIDQQEINFYFDNINLPFETADPEGSNGYITYKIKPKSDVVIGDVIDNKAYIFFDFNQPIITNTVSTTIVDNLSTTDFNQLQILVYPNPVKDELFIKLPSGLQVNVMKLFNINGQMLKSFEEQSVLDLKDLSQGVYILKVETDQGLFHKKVVKR